MITIRTVRIRDIGTLPPEQMIPALAMAFEELAIVKALIIVHGEESGRAEYVKRGGHVRFDSEGEPVLIWQWPQPTTDQPTEETS